MTRFGTQDLSAYAEDLVVADARKGITILGLLSLLLLSAAALLYAWLGYDTSYVYTCALLALLALHISVSARALTESKVLYLLGITLLVVCSMAFVLLAHKHGSFNTPLFATVVLLFMVLPLVPWGLREATVVVCLVYLLVTLSTLAVQGRFDAESLWVLQFLMLAAGVTSLTVIARGVDIRKHDIKTRYELEQAHRRMEDLSFKDPLTGAWNRRFLDQRFRTIVDRFRAAGGAYHLALIDVDDFKQLNDGHGHDYGDLTLRRLVAVFAEQLGDDGYLVRMGGDEFSALFCSDDPEGLIWAGLEALQCGPMLTAARSAGVQQCRNGQRQHPKAG
jgi:GGDEF domain-containing protein